MNKIPKYISLGIGHGLNDCIAGFLIGSLFYQSMPLLEVGILTMIFNLVAFGGQLAIAKIFETHYQPKRALYITLSLLITALIVFEWTPKLAVLCAGVGSAIFHVTGGVEATREDGKAFGIGLFASPGVLGLILGGFMAYLKVDFCWIGVGLCFSYLLGIFLFFIPSRAFTKITEEEERVFEGHDVIMVLLILVIALRSFVWDVVQLVEEGNYNYLIVIAIAAMLGKIIGGFLSDIVGYKNYSILALICSMPLLSYFKKDIVALSVGVMLLQSTIPPTTVMVLQLVKRKPALGIALSFGLSIMIAIGVFYTPMIRYLSNSKVVFGALLLSVFLLLWYKFRKGLVGKELNT